MRQPEQAVGRAGGPVVRLAEVLATFSLATDLGMGVASEHALRTCLLAIELADTLGADAATRAEVYDVALLRRIGCTSDAHALAMIFGDDLAAHARVFQIDLSHPPTLLLDVLRHAGAGRRLHARVATIGAALAAGPGMPGNLFRGSCEVAERLSAQVGVDEPVRTAIGHTFERWDGRGVPAGLRGEEIRLSARLVQVAEETVALAAVGGVEAARRALRERAGRSLDPIIAARCRERVPQLLHALDERDAWDAVLAAEPPPHRWLDASELDSALAAGALFADLKSPWFASHSTGVAALAADAARQAGLPGEDVVAARRAGWLHDLGRVGVPTGDWDRPGPLPPAAWERVRLHPYVTERVLLRSSALAPLGRLAGQHHERLDGSGYIRGLQGNALSPLARILAAADVYHALIEARPHRAAHSSEAAASELWREVRAGRLDGEAADAVLRAAGHRMRRRPDLPGRLSPREVEVLRLVAQGLPNRAIAGRLSLRPATVAAHIRHIYDKAGITTRAGATLWAMQHGLFDPLEVAEASSE